MNAFDPQFDRRSFFAASAAGIASAGWAWGGQGEAESGTTDSIPKRKPRVAAINSGMRTLMEDGKLKVLKGVTTPQEIAHIAQIEGLE